MQRRAGAIKDVLNHIGVVRIGIVLGCEWFLVAIAERRPAGLGDENRNVGEVEIAHREVGGVKHSIKDVSVVEQGVGVDLLTGRRERAKERVVKRNNTAGAGEDVVRIEIEHKRRRSGGEEAKEREDETRDQGLVEESLGRGKGVDDGGERERSRDRDGEIGKRRVEGEKSREEKGKRRGKGERNVVANSDGGDRSGRMEREDVAGDPGSGGGRRGAEGEELVVGDAEKDVDAGAVECR